MSGSKVEWSVRVDSKGIRRILKSAPMRSVVNRAARKVARGAGPDASVSEYTTDREAASVGVPAEQQAIHGRLTRAAAKAGLEVRAP
ncbi:hypothetical protein AB0I72_00490 [Nocardiopsis sp. NPDC049922]|uniref:hypothetical protein n=1 Tax=Nocardiopsis sp. NPDC049922 TaxID=3155157 RepID=UPI0033D3E248